MEPHRFEAGAEPDVCATCEDAPESAIHNVGEPGIDFGAAGSLSELRMVAVQDPVGAAHEIDRLRRALDTAHGGLLRALDFRTASPEGLSIKGDVRVALIASGATGSWGEVNAPLPPLGLDMIRMAFETLHRALARARGMTESEDALDPALDRMLNPFPASAGVIAALAPGSRIKQVVVEDLEEPQQFSLWVEGPNGELKVVRVAPAEGSRYSPRKLVFEVGDWTRP